MVQSIGENVNGKNQGELITVWHVKTRVDSQVIT